MAPVVKRESKDHLAQYLRKKCGPGKASLGSGIVGRSRRVHAALAWTGAKTEPGRHQTIARRIRLGRSRNKSRVARLQRRRTRWQHRVRLIVRPMEIVLAQRIEHLIEELDGWSI